MSLFSFVKEAGEKLVKLLTPGNANASDDLKKHIEEVGLGNPDVHATVEGDKVTLTGTVASQEEKEKIILAAGNIAGVASVDDQITVTGPVVAAARFVVQGLVGIDGNVVLPPRTRRQQQRRTCDCRAATSIGAHLVGDHGYVGSDAKRLA